MRKISLIVGILCVVITAKAELEIVKEGVSVYQVVIAPQALSVVKAAADDLISYLNKSTGAKLRLSQSGEISGKPSIVVGDCVASRNAGIDVNKISAEGFVIKTIGRDLYIVGRDTAGDSNSDHWYSAPQAGTWSGVSTFLQKYLDVRWFMPGDEGEYVLETRNLTLGDINISDAPKMDYRRMSYLSWEGMSQKRTDETKRWKRRNLNGWSVRWRAWHIWLSRMPTQKYFKQHPEWFAEVNGNRLEYAPHGVQLCTTNPGALDELAQDILNDKIYLDATFSLSPNDGGNHCECEKCRALDMESLSNGHPVLTDRYVTYCNEVARRVLENDPTKTFAFYAYSYYSNPPLRTKLNHKVRVMHVLNGINILYYSPKIREMYVSQKLIPWKNAVGELYFYTHPSGMGNIALPSFHKEAIKYLFVDLKRVGITGISMNNSAGFDASGLDNYLYEKMAWNPGADIDVIYRDALDKCYGNDASPYVNEYFDVVGGAVAKFADVMAIDMALGSGKRFPKILDISYDGLYEKGMPLLEKASAQIATKNQRFRLQMLIDNLRYCKDTVDLYKLSQKILKSKPSRHEVIEAIKLAESRMNYLGRLEKAGRLCIDTVVTTEKGSYLPFAPEIYQAMLADLSGGVRIAEASWLGKGVVPRLDGKLDDLCWGKVKTFNVDYDNPTGIKVKLQTTAKAVYDDQYLYLGIFCQESEPEMIKDSCRQADGPVWNDNNIDMFFIPVNSNNLKHIIVNSLGTVCDVDVVNGEENFKWSSDIKTATVHTKDGWNLELAIPFSKLSDKAPKMGNIWGFNIFRVRPINKQYMSFSPTFGLFAKPERFGKLIFK